ncbi:NAD(P)-binding protein [Schizophyllum commune Tattone D]|nr:NAD(P)-binding protein [Schizophyllum commune Tattone D]
MTSARVALVTGAAQGIGKAIALRLNSDGFAIALSDLPAKREALEEVAKLINSGGGRAAVFTGDVSIEEDVKNMVDGAAEALGGFHVIVANAGISIPRSLLEETSEGFDLQMAVNARSVFLAFKHAARQILAQGHREGRLIAACSICGKHGYTNTAAYSASKFAIRGITQSAAHELGPHGITVNAYAPGGIDTEMSERLRPSVSSFALKRHFLARMANSVPVKRIGQPEDIANLVSYLASKEASYMTGQTASIVQLYVVKFLIL